MSININSLENAMELIHKGFNKEIWQEVHNFSANNNDWCISKSKILEKDTDFCKSITNIEWHELLCEKEFPLTYGEVLEIGGHFGRFSLYKALNFPEMRLSVTDISTDITKLTIKHLELLNIKNIKRYTMFSEDIEFKNDIFDRVYALETIEHVGDLNKSLLEIKRVLKIGGDFIFALPFNDWADGGFHTQKHSEEFWKDKLKEYFTVTNWILMENGNSVCGRGEKI